MQEGNLVQEHGKLAHIGGRAKGNVEKGAMSSGAQEGADVPPSGGEAPSGPMLPKPAPLRGAK